MQQVLVLPELLLQDFLTSHIVLFDSADLNITDYVDLAKIERDELITTKLDSGFIYVKLTEKGFTLMESLLRTENIEEPSHEFKLNASLYA